MKLCNFVIAYEQSLVARNQEATDLKARIDLLASRVDQSSSRFAARLSIYEHQLATLDRKHRAASCWVRAVADPLLSLITKRLGGDFRGDIRIESDNEALLSFVHSVEGYKRSMLLKMKMTQLAAEPFPECVTLELERVVTLEDNVTKDAPPLETTISDLVVPLRAA